MIKDSFNETSEDRGTIMKRDSVGSVIGSDGIEITHYAIGKQNPHASAGFPTLSSSV